jgi:hypothetical protein
MIKKLSRRAPEVLTTEDFQIFRAWMTNSERWAYHHIDRADAEYIFAQVDEHPPGRIHPKEENPWPPNQSQT